MMKTKLKKKVIHFDHEHFAYDIALGKVSDIYLSPTEIYIKRKE